MSDRSPHFGTLTNNFIPFLQQQQQLYFHISLIFKIFKLANFTTCTCQIARLSCLFVRCLDVYSLSGEKGALRGGGCSRNFHMVRFCSEVRTLTLLYAAIFDRKCNLCRKTASFFIILGLFESF